MFYLRDVGIFLGFLFALGVLSHRVWRRSENLGGLEATALTCGFALGSCSLLIWLIGLTVGAGWVSLLGFLLPCALVFWRSRTARRVEKAVFWRVLALDEKLLTLYLCAVFAMTFALCLAPPVGNDYDSLMYHLAAPAQYLRAGKIVVLPYDHHTFFPFATEMLFLLGLKLSGPVLAKLFHWLMLPLCCATIIAVAQRHDSRRAGLFGAALFAAIPLVQYEATTAYIDLALVAYTLLAFLCLLRWMTSGERTLSTRNGAFDNRWLLACGIFCGFGLGTKYFGLIPLFWFLLAAIGVMARRKCWQIQPLLTMFSLAMVIGGGWYARNFFATGNPVFPFAYSVFGGRGWSQPLADEYTRANGTFGFDRSPIDLIWLPWRLSMTPLNFDVKQLLGQPFWPVSDALINAKSSTRFGSFEVNGLLLNSFLGPALLALGAPLLFIKRKPLWVRFAGWSVLFFSLAWAFSSQTIRYALPLFALLCWPCGWGLSFYTKRSAPLKWTASVFFVAWGLWSPWVVARQNRSVFSVVLGAQTSDKYMTRRAPGFSAMKWLNDNSAASALVAVYGEPRCFYLQRNYFWADAAHNTLIDYSAIHSAHAWIQALRGKGATHVLVNLAPGANDGYGTAPPQLAAAQAQGLVRPTFRTRFYSVFEIVAP